MDVPVGGRSDGVGYPRVLHRRGHYHPRSLFISTLHPTLYTKGEGGRTLGTGDWFRSLYLYLLRPSYYSQMTYLCTELR